MVRSPAPNFFIRSQKEPVYPPWLKLETADLHLPHFRSHPSKTADNWLMSLLVKRHKTFHQQDFLCRVLTEKATALEESSETQNPSSRLQNSN